MPNRKCSHLRSISTAANIGDPPSSFPPPKTCLGVSFSQRHRFCNYPRFGARRKIGITPQFRDRIITPLPGGGASHFASAPERTVSRHGIRTSQPPIRDRRAETTYLRRDA